MATVTIVGTFAVNLGANQANSISFTLPSGIQDGDFGCFIIGTNSTTDTVGTPPAGWTMSADSPQIAGAADESWLFTRSMLASDSGQTVTVAGMTTSGRLQVVGLVARGTLDNETASADSASNTSITFNPITPVANDCLEVHLAYNRYASGSLPSVTPPPGFTEFADQASTNTSKPVFASWGGYKQLVGQAGVQQPSDTATANTGCYGTKYTLTIAPAGAVAPPNAGSAAGTIGYAGSATGSAPVVQMSGSASGAVNYAGSASGARAADGAGTGAVAWSGSSAGSRASAGDGVGSLAWTGSATGVRPSEGSGSGAVGFAGTAAGSRTAQGSTTGQLGYTGSSSGSRSSAGSSSGSVAYVGNARGAVPGGGSASGVVAWTGSASGSTTRGGDAAGAVGFTGNAQGSAPAVGTSSGSASGVVDWSGHGANGGASHRGTGAGHLDHRGSASGVAPGVAGAGGSAAGHVGFTGSAQGQRIPVGQAAADIAWHAVGSGSTRPLGSADGAVAWSGQSLGAVPVYGSAAGSLAWLGTAVGRSPLPYVAAEDARASLVTASGVAKVGSGTAVAASGQRGGEATMGTVTGRAER